MAWIARLVMILHAGLLAALPALAADKPALCKHAAAIVEIATFLTEDPPNPSRFWRNRFAVDAAYLAIRYGGVTYPAGSAMLARVAENRHNTATRIGELRLAFADRADRAALFDALAKAAENAGVLNQIGPSAMRAMLREGDSARLYAVFDRWRASPEVGPSEAMLADALLDLDDQDKSRLAAGAEAAGEWNLAGRILRSRSDLSEWLALRKRAPDAAKTPEALQDEYVAAVRLMGRPTPLDLDKLPAEMAAARDFAWAFQAQQEALVAAARLSPRTQILATLFNQTGEVRIASVVAVGLVRAVAGGELDAADGDAVVVRMAGELEVLLGQRQLQDLLALFDAPEAWAGPVDNKARSAVDRAVARHALAALARGETGTPPPRPASLSSDFPWQAWADAAASKRPVGPDKGGQGLDFEIATLKGDFETAIAIIKSLENPRLAQFRANALMRDLDWRCSKLLGPANPFGLPVYVFDRE